jgi:Zn-dependent peptidase ImmA (M78 family)
MRRDHKVRFRREESIESIALECRQEAGNQNDAFFNVTDFVERVLPRILIRLKKGVLQIKFDVQDGDEFFPAYVTHNPPTLHIHSEIWADAKLGEPEARRVVAHEVGHLVLHDHYAQPFSADESAQIKFVQKEERGEWQADTFASYFLLAKRVLASYQTAKEVAQAASIPTDVAEDRVAAAREEQLRQERIARSRKYTGDFCTCGNATLRPFGLGTKCETCDQVHPGQLGKA